VAPNLEQFTGYPTHPQSPLWEISEPQLPGPVSGIRKRIDFMASHMVQQWKAHEASQKRTADLFEQLLCQLEETVATFQQSFYSRDIPIGSVYAKIDADRSIGILYLLWHTISFSMRGNLRPMALGRNGREPLFAGRIVAFLGDYHENVISLGTQDYPDLLEDELASLYIPASPIQPAVMKFGHRKDELFFNQAEASEQFLMKILEVVCGGGYFHETALD
jgi:hypothetical protein